MGKPEDGEADQADMQQLNGRRNVPTAAEKGEAFFQVRISAVNAAGDLQHLRVFLLAVMRL